MLDLLTFVPQNPYLICIDSDGCALDTMETKHRQCFIPLTIQHWGLEVFQAEAERAALFVYLYSRTRGAVRYILLHRLMDILEEQGLPIPDISGFRAFMADDDSPKTLTGLKNFADLHPTPDLQTAIEWAEAIDREVKNLTAPMGAFEGVHETLALLQKQADVVVVSVTPTAQVQAEWHKHDLLQYVTWLTGQEAGTKVERLAHWLNLGYDPDKVLMLGDAIGDYEAAAKNRIHFYPILAKQEVRSWEHFQAEGLDRFLRGNYTPEYQRTLVEEFYTSLPENYSNLTTLPMPKN